MKPIEFRTFRIDESFFGVQWNFQKPWNAKGRSSFYRKDFPALTGKSVKSMSIDGQSRSSLVITKSRELANEIFDLAVKDGAVAVAILSMKKIRQFPDGEVGRDLKLS